MLTTLFWVAGRALKLSYHNEYMGVSQNWSTLFGGPNNKDYSILGSILGSPNCGKLPYIYSK